MNRKIVCVIVLMVGLAGALAYVMSYAREDVVVNTTTLGGRIVFLDNISHGTYYLGDASADPERNMSFSNPVPFVEAGIGGSTFTATWRDIRNDEPNDEKIAVFTLTVWDPAGRPYSTSLESGQMGSGLMSVSLSSPESGEGQFSLTSTILERKLNISAPAGL
ncbi:MAG TPA: hypothetical protein PK196_08170 [Methanoculleus sp.]|jgi:hypothetical protein|nr:hypothetical protein [Methanoculleus sp.]HRD26383.1 hypothetical protein [Methanoculleus sp.]